MPAVDVEAAVDAAASSASTLGLNVAHADVLQASNRLVVRLLPCDVVVRVAHETHWASSQLEVEVARRLVESGAPVAALDSRVEPIVYERDGFVLSHWTYYAPVAPSNIEPLEYARALEQLHAGMSQIDLPAPSFIDRVDEALLLVSSRALTPDLVDADRELLMGTLRDGKQAISVRGGREQLLHGEPHPGNLLATKSGLLFVDLETCCRGPIEFDVAHAPEEVSQFYLEADPQLVAECRVLMLAMVAAWRWDKDDRFPDGRHMGTELIDRLRTARDSLTA